MKVFEFDPATGKRGDLIGNVRVFGTANPTMAKCSLPRRPGADWSVATKLFGRNNDEIKFDRPVCLCIGQFTAGTDTSWQWVAYLPQ